MAKAKKTAPFEWGCNECVLKDLKRVPPKIVGKDTRGVLFLGESPTDDEAEGGQLLTGDQSKLMTYMINRFQIKDYAITNCVLCYPGKKKKAKVKEILRCSVFRDSFVQEYAPSKIVCLGKTAAKTILGKELGKEKMYILRERSPFLLEDGTPVFVAHSPKAITKQHKLVDDFLADFQFAFDPPPNTWITPEVLYHPTRGAWVDWYGGQVDDITRPDIFPEAFARPVAVDFETTGLHPKIHRPTTISMSWWPEESIVVNLKDMNDEEMAVTLSEIAHLLELSERVIYHESKFDMKFFKQWSDIKPPLGWDTKIADYAMKGNPESSRGLKYLARRMLYAPVYDADIDFEGNTSIEDMATYNGMDTSATYQIYDSTGRSLFYAARGWTE